MISAFRFITTSIGLFLIGMALIGLLLIGPFSHLLAWGAARDLSRIHGTDVTLADLKVRPFQGRVELQGVTLSNPPPYRAGPAAVFERVVIHLDLPAILSGQPRIARVVASGTTIHLRHQAADGTNIGALARAANAAAQEQRRDAAEEATPGTAGFQVGAIRSEGTVIRLSSDLLPELEVPLEVRDFALDGLDTHGRLVRAEIGSLVLRSMLLEATGIPGIAEPIRRVLRDEAQETGSAS